MECYIGVDIGTSGVRAVSYDTNGVQIWKSQRAFPLICTEPGMGEINPMAVYDNLVKTVAECAQNSGTVRGIGFSALMHTVMMLDSEDNPLTNAYTWADTRAAEEAERLKDRTDFDELCNTTGCYIAHPLYPIGQLIWIRNKYPFLFDMAKTVMSLKQYVIMRLCGEKVIDVSDASSTGMFDIRQLCWDKKLTGIIAGLPDEMLCDTVACTHKLRILDTVAEVMGLPLGTELTVGSTDGLLANLGCGIFDSESASSTIGTSGAIRTVLPSVPDNCGTTLWCAAFLENAYVSGGAISNGGVTIKWLRDRFWGLFEPESRRRGMTSIYALFDSYCEQLPPGSDGLCCIPTFIGERCPDWPYDTTAGLHGLRLDHDVRHIVRACMEGVMFRFYTLFRQMQLSGAPLLSIYANGGYARSRPWLQMQADLFGRSIVRAGADEAAALGAAYLAMIADGQFEYGHKLPAMAGLETFEPNHENKNAYEDAYSRYLELYARLNGA